MKHNGLHITADKTIYFAIKFDDEYAAGHVEKGQRIDTGREIWTFDKKEELKKFIDENN